MLQASSAQVPLPSRPTTGAQICLDPFKTLYVYCDQRRTRRSCPARCFHPSPVASVGEVEPGYETRQSKPGGVKFLPRSTACIFGNSNENRRLSSLCWMAQFVWRRLNSQGGLEFSLDLKTSLLDRGIFAPATLSGELPPVYERLDRPNSQ